MSRKSCPFVNSEYTLEVGQDFLDILYNLPPDTQDLKMQTLQINQSNNVDSYKSNKITGYL